MKNGKLRLYAVALVLALASAFCSPALAEPSLKETMDNIVTRFYADMDQEALSSLTHDSVLTLITEEEQEVLSTKYWFLNVNVPVVVSVIRNVDQPVGPFWLGQGVATPCRRPT